MIQINIIIVGYNEEENLPKLFASLSVLKEKYEPRVIYIDQESTDTSLMIARTS
jgi:GT2 family glycosyltransferase